MMEYCWAREVLQTERDTVMNLRNEEAPRQSVNFASCRANLVHPLTVLP